MSKGFKHIGTGLLVALFLINITTFSIIPCYGSTVSDLKELLEITDETNDETVEDEYNVIIENKNDSSKNGSVLGGKSVDEQYSSSLIRLQDRLGQYMSEDAPAVTIISTINNIIDVQTKLDKETKDTAYENMGNTQAPIPDSSITQELAGEYEEKGISDPEFSIGDVGSTSISVTGSYRMIVTPWGYIVNDDGIKSEKLLGVEFGTRHGDKINSQWNGIVTSITDDGISSGKEITIFHGNNLYTKYSHVKPNSDLASGSKINQGQQIGTAIDTTSSEPNKREHMYYQIILDEKYINPILVYGNSGKTLYENWYKLSSEVNVIDEDEEYFTTDDNINMDKYVKGSTDDVLYSDFNIKK